MACLFAAIAGCLVLLALVAPPCRAAIYDTDIVGTTALADNATIKAAAPDVSCAYGGLMTSDGKVLWTRDANAQVPMASTTKIMTAIVALDAGSLDDTITVSQTAADAEGSTASLTAGDQLTLEQMLYAMMLPSGNDAAIAIAEYYGAGSVDSFVALMNSKATAVGLTGTHYSSPSGLSDDDNYTTANDYLVLVSYAMQNPTFRTVVATSEYRYTSTVTGAVVTLESTNELLGQYDGIEGIKTGFTDAAGYCFVGACKRGDIELYSVVFASTDEEARFTDTTALFDWGFSHYHAIELIGSNTAVGEAVATDWLDKTVTVTTGEAVTAVLFDYDPDLSVEVELTDRAGTIEAGSTMGTMSWLQDDQLVATTQLVAGETIYSPGLFERIQIGWSKFASFFTGDAVSVEQRIDAASSYLLIGANG